MAAASIDLVGAVLWRRPNQRYTKKQTKSAYDPPNGGCCHNLLLALSNDPPCSESTTSSAIFEHSRRGDMRQLTSGCRLSAPRNTASRAQQTINHDCNRVQFRVCSVLPSRCLRGGAGRLSGDQPGSTATEKQNYRVLHKSFAKRYTATVGQCAHVFERISDPTGKLRCLAERSNVWMSTSLPGTLPASHRVCLSFRASSGFSHAEFLPLLHLIHCNTSSHCVDLRAWPTQHSLPPFSRAVHTRTSVFTTTLPSLPTKSHSRLPKCMLHLTHNVLSNEKHRQSRNSS